MRREPARLYYMLAGTLSIYMEWTRADILSILAEIACKGVTLTTLSKEISAFIHRLSACAAM